MRDLWKKQRKGDGLEVKGGVEAFIVAGLGIGWWKRVACELG